MRTVRDSGAGTTDQVIGVKLLGEDEGAQAGCASTDATLRSPAVRDEHFSPFRPASDDRSRERWEVPAGTTVAQLGSHD
jgi:hypothetical protein